MFGRERRIADIPTDHPSCSNQHAVIQFRRVRKDDERKAKVRPYVIDLDSRNGTFVNGEKIEGSRYMELFERDMIKLGTSSREYILLNENSVPGGFSEPTADGGE
jgi:smad nuclear-interacting protein 1